MPSYTTAAALLRYAEDEYLSELLARKLTPKPSAAPPRDGVVSMEWGLVIPGSSKLQMYLLRAEGVTTWQLDGDHNKHGELQLRAIDEAPGGGIALELGVPGTLTLFCASVTIECGPLRRYTSPLKIAANTFLVFGPQEVTWTQLLTWLAPPTDIQLFLQRGDGRKGMYLPVDASTYNDAIVPIYYEMLRLSVAMTDIVPWLFVHWMLGVGAVGHYFSVSRGTCSATEWAHVQQLPAHLGDCEVMSGSIRVSGTTWMSKWAPATPPQLTT